jgi:ubiquinone/menaquinone biosynthesis C-methylase UbiE
MKINYQETTSDLITRIDIHNKYGGRDIDQWMLQILKLEKGIKILDQGCGAGKLCFSFYDYLKGDCEILGTDLNKELLDKARQENQKRGALVNFREMDFNQPYAIEDGAYDLVSCSFAIYYAINIPFTIKEMHRVLKPGGRLFTTGPMPENKKIFYEIIHEATHKTIPPMPGSSRYESEILKAMRTLFDRVDVHIFENPLTFETIEPFMDYTRASLSEDRKLWNNFFDEKDDFESIIKKITGAAEERLKADGKLVMTKVVGGFLATK